MADTTFSNGTVVEADWLQDVNDLTYSFTQPGAGSVAREASEKLRDFVHIKDFDAVCDGVADDSAARTAAFDYCIANKRVLIISGWVRVTSGYTNSTVGGDLHIVGESPSYTSTGAAAGGTGFLLDNASSGSFFYLQSASNELIVEDTRFACAQQVPDRKFFRTSAVSVKQTISNVHFSGVEQPFVFDSGTYFQMSSYRDIRFTNSGSFHSKASGSGFATGLVGTLMLIENCDVEGAVPTNTEKIICNLAGVRHVRATNLLIEPSTPSSGWVGLKLSNPYDPAWTRYPTASFNGFYIEVTGSGVDYIVDQDGGRTKFSSATLNATPTSRYRVTNSGCVALSEVGLTGTSDAISDLFVLGDYMCQVKLSDTTYREAGSAVIDPKFWLENCSRSPSGGAGTEQSRATAHNNLLSQCLWRFDGGFPDAGQTTVSVFSGSSYAPTTNATYGRAISLTHSGGVIDFRLQAFTRNDFAQGSQFFIVLKGTLPTFATGTVGIDVLVDGVVSVTAKTFTTADSGASFDLVFPLTAPSADPTSIGFSVGCTTAASQMLVYQAEIWVGKSVPNVLLPSYPANVITWASSSPSTGTWARGDVCYNNTPSAGGIPGWVCTAAGSPGTWKAMAAVAP